MTKKEIQDIRPGDIIFNMSKREAYKIQEVHEGYVTYEGVPHAGSFPKTSLEKWDMVSLMRDREEPQTKEEETGKEVELTHFEGELFSVISDFWQSYMKGEEVNVVNFVKEHSPSLLEAAHEWSEEDERMVESINLVFDAAAEHNIASEDKTLYKMRAWLKTPHQWKPSEEDKKELKEAIEVLDESIKSLRFNLEKL